jgi:hypothetical protein
MTNKNDTLSPTSELYRKRLEVNLAILCKLQELIYQDPGARFGQILAWVGFGDDHFDEEPWDSLERMDARLLNRKVKE